MAYILTPSRLAKADKQAEKAAKPYREKRAEAIATYMGERKGKRRPINPTAQAINTLIAAITPERLGYLVKPRRIDLRAESEFRQAAIRRAAEELGLPKLYEDILFDALTGPFGITLSGIRAGAAMVKVNDQDVDPGAVFIRRIDLDDYAIDPMARHRSEAYWERHKYRVPRWFALESGVFAGKEDIIEGIPGIADLDHDEGAKSQSQDKWKEEDSNVCDLIELADYAIYEGETVRLVTMPVTKQGVDGSNEFLLDTEYEGPEGSPYSVLQFFRVPDNVYGPSLVSLFADLSDAIEEVGAKMVREGVKAKQVFAAEKAAAEDAETIRKAADGAVVLVDNVDALKQFDVGGVVKDLYPFFQMLRGEFNNASLSSQLIGGQAALGDTATEASILQGNATQSIAWMRRKFASLLISDAKRLGWYLQHDPLIRVPMPYRIKGSEWITVEYTPEIREGEFHDFGYEYAVDTMQSTDPAVKSKRLQEALATFTGGLQPIVQAGGNPQTWARIIGEQFDIPDLDEVVNQQDFYMRQMALMQGVPDEGRGMPGQPAGMDPMGGVPRGTGASVGGRLGTTAAQTRQAYSPAMAAPQTQGAY